MPTHFIARSLSVAPARCALLAVISHPSYADRRRSGLDELSKEMSTRSAYFSLFSAVVGNAKGPEPKAQFAERIKGNGRAMLAQAINAANYIGVGEDVVMQRAQAAMAGMVATINADPVKSLHVVHGKCGQPCGDPLEKAPQRFADLIAGEREDF
jgi:hypothetical protein